MDELERKIQEQAKINAMVETAKNPQNAVRFEVSNKVSEELRNNQDVAKSVQATAQKNIKSALTTVENEAEKAVNESETGKLQSYFEQHKEELETAGIEEYTYMEDMQRAVKWHRKCAKLHWVLFGWWMTLIRTFLKKAKPFKWLLNSIGVLLNVVLIGSVIFGIIKLIEIL